MLRMQWDVFLDLRLCVSVGHTRLVPSLAEARPKSNMLQQADRAMEIFLTEFALGPHHARCQWVAVPMGSVAVRAQTIQAYKYSRARRAGKLCGGWRKVKEGWVVQARDQRGRFEIQALRSFKQDPTHAGAVTPHRLKPEPQAEHR